MTKRDSDLIEKGFRQLFVVGKLPGIEFSDGRNFRSRFLAERIKNHILDGRFAGAPRPIESDHQAVPAPPTANGRSQGFGERSTSELVLASGQDGAIRRKPIVLLRCLGLIHGLKLWRAVAGTFYGPIDSTADRNCSQVSN